MGNGVYIWAVEPARGKSVPKQDGAEIIQLLGHFDRLPPCKGKSCSLQELRHYKRLFLRSSAAGCKEGLSCAPHPKLAAVGCEASTARKRIRTEELSFPTTGAANEQNPVPIMPCKDDENCVADSHLGRDCQIAALRSECKFLAGIRQTTKNSFCFCSCCCFFDHWVRVFCTWSALTENSSRPCPSPCLSTGRRDFFSLQVPMLMYVTQKFIHFRMYVLLYVLWCHYGIQGLRETLAYFRAFRSSFSMRNRSVSKYAISQ